MPAAQKHIQTLVDTAKSSVKSTFPSAFSIVGNKHASDALPTILPLEKHEEQKMGRVRSIAHAFHILLLTVSVCVYLIGDVTADLNWMLVGVCLLWAANMLYGALRVKDRLLFFALHAGIFLFLLTRPMFSGFDPAHTWHLKSFESTEFALMALFASMLTMYATTALCTAVTSYNARRKVEQANMRPRQVRDKRQVKTTARANAASQTEQGESISYNQYGIASFAKKKVTTLFTALGSLDAVQRRHIIRFVSAVCFFICAIFAIYGGVIKLSYMSGHAYTDYYLTESSQYIPWSVDVMSVMMPYMMCSYLACLPNRRNTVLCLLVYIFTTVPMLVIGSRSAFVLAFVFAALYFIFRATTDKEEQWISKRLIACVCVALPLGIALMGFWDFMRAGKETNLDFLALVAESLYRQGVSFTVLGHGFDVNPQVQALGFKFYSLGNIQDTITQGFIGQTFFDFPLLPSTNSYELATQGTSYSHAMSFFAHSNYLGGEGYGSSYILELYADFGFAGIIVGSAIIAACFYGLMRSLGTRWFWGTCALLAGLVAMHMARGTACEWINFIWSTRFLLAVFVIMFLSAVLAYILQLTEQKKHVAAFQLPQTIWGFARMHKENLARVSLSASGNTNKVITPNDGEQ